MADCDLRGSAAVFPGLERRLRGALVLTVAERAATVKPPARVGAAQRLIVASAMILVIVGVGARFVHLDRLFYFHDEAATSLRLSGRTSADYARFAGGHLITAGQIARFQTADGAGLGRTVHSLAVDDPQHPPLFFAIERLWAGAFGSSISSLRALAAIFGLLLLVSGGWLVQALFGSRTTTLVAVALLAISPFQILYSDVAREYSLWLAFVAAAGAALVTALRVTSTLWLASYAFLLVAALYTFPNTLLVIVGHAVYVVLSTRPRAPNLRRFALAAGVALALYLPWLAVMALERGALRAGTNWTGEVIPFAALLRSWLVVSGLGVVDHAGSQSAVGPRTAVLFGAVLLVEIAALVALRARGPRAAWLFVVTLIGACVIPLAGADLVDGGVRSTIPRYLAPMYLGLTIAVAFLLSEGLRLRARIPRSAFAVLALAVVVAAVGSYVARGDAPVWWTQDDGAAAENLAVARMVNSLPRPLLISTGMGTLLEMSHYLRPDIPIRVVVNGQEPPVAGAGHSIVLYGSPANGTAAARLASLLRDIRARGPRALRPVSPPLPCCGDGIRPIPWQVWRLTAG